MSGGRLIFLLVVIAGAIVLWRIDVAHRDACRRSGQAHCSLLPWSGGVGSNAGGGGGGTIGGAVHGTAGVGSSVNGLNSNSASKLP